MFQQIIAFLLRLFSWLPGTGRRPGPPAVPGRPADLPPAPPPLAGDNTELPKDSVIIVNDLDLFMDGLFETIDRQTPAIPDDPDFPTTSSAEPAPADRTGRYLWCLDNGHGKLQPGKRSPLFDDGTTRFFEYAFNRDIVERIMKALDRHGIPYYDIVPDYRSVGSFLEERIRRANEKATLLPKIYVSVHANAGPARDDSTWVDPRINGVETWHAQGSRKGMKIAAVFQKHLVQHTGMKNRNLKSTAEKQLAVLVRTRMPAILTECGFYNNKEEAAKLMQDDFRQHIADAHVAAILEIEEKGI
ncbi:MAG: hypothetical protein RLY31_2446 [Bacteroidota bacterium]